MMMGDMKVISIRQPWAWLIVAGHKDIENRDWPTKVRGRVAIHAGKYRPQAGEIAEIEKEFGVKINPAELKYGGIIGTAEIVDCVEDHDSCWFFGEFGFVLADARPGAFLPCQGKLGFFEVAYDLSQRPPINIPVVLQSQLL